MDLLSKHIPARSILAISRNFHAVPERLAPEPDKEGNGAAQQNKPHG